jgi:hypothetical protein
MPEKHLVLGSQLSLDLGRQRLAGTEPLRVLRLVDLPFFRGICPEVQTLFEVLRNRPTGVIAERKARIRITFHTDRQTRNPATSRSDRSPPSLLLRSLLFGRRNQP